MERLPRGEDICNLRRAEREKKVHYVQTMNSPHALKKRKKSRRRVGERERKRRKREKKKAKKGQRMSNNVCAFLSLSVSLSLSLFLRLSLFSPLPPSFAACARLVPQWRAGMETAVAKERLTLVQHFLCFWSACLPGGCLPPQSLPCIAALAHPPVRPRLCCPALYDKRAPRLGRACGILSRARLSNSPPSIHPWAPFLPLSQA